MHGKRRTKFILSNNYLYLDFVLSLLEENKNVVTIRPLWLVSYPSNGCFISLLQSELDGILGGNAQLCSLQNWWYLITEKKI